MFHLRLSHVSCHSEWGCCHSYIADRRCFICCLLVDLQWFNWTLTSCWKVCLGWPKVLLKKYILWSMRSPLEDGGELYFRLVLPDRMKVKWSHHGVDDVVTLATGWISYLVIVDIFVSSYVMIYFNIQKGSFMYVQRVCSLICRWNYYRIVVYSAVWRS